MEGRECRQQRMKKADDRQNELPVQSFAELCLFEGLLKGLESAKIQRPNALQAAVLPELLRKPSNGRLGPDVFVRSAPQSGKKTAFLIGAIQRIDPALKQTQVLVIQPTAELAHYTTALAKELTKYTEIRVGHATREDDLKLPMNEQLVFSNCGTVLHFMHTPFLRLNAIRCVIMDEFDLLTSSSINCGKLFDVLNYVARCSAFQVQIFSTAMGPTALEFTFKHFTKDLTTFDLMAEEDCMDNLVQFFVSCSTNAAQKYRTLRQLLKSTTLDKILIFITSKHDALFVHENLQMDGYKVILLSSKSSIGSRLNAIKLFNDSRDEQIVFIMNYPVGQGIGLENLRVIINYELPFKANELHFDYFHKVAKCDRSQPSFVVNMVAHNEFTFVRTLEKFFKIRFIQLSLAED